MKVVHTRAELAGWLTEQRAAGRRVGLVPTMGALHAGHQALAAACRPGIQAVAMSIFVNPTQFAPGEDFERYPRNLERDLERAELAGVDLVFAPGAEEMYPFREVRISVDPGRLGSVLEGQFRPTFFRGVATIVSKLLVLFRPDVTVFGQKDAQQVVVVRALARELLLPVEVRVIPTVREPDGLALSSRNVYLSPEERQAAPVLHNALRSAEALIRGGERDAGAVTERLTGILGTQSLARVDYASVVDAQCLEPIPVVDGKVLLLLAVRFGQTRLLDNACLRIEGERVLPDLP